MLAVPVQFAVDHPVVVRGYELIAAGCPQRGVRAGLLSTLHGPTHAARLCGWGRSNCEYWMRKLTDVNYHAGTYGGARNRKYNVVQQGVVDHCLSYVVNNYPCENPARYTAAMEALGVPRVTVPWIRRALRRLGFSRNEFIISNVENSPRLICADT